MSIVVSALEGAFALGAGAGVLGEAPAAAAGGGGEPGRSITTSSTAARQRRAQNTFFTGNTSGSGPETRLPQILRRSSRRAEDVGDPNVPLVNSYEWFHALRDNGVQVEFYACPADTHFPGDIVRTTDVYRRWVGWMTTHLK